MARMRTQTKAKAALKSRRRQPWLLQASALASATVLATFASSQAQAQVAPPTPGAGIATRANNGVAVQGTFTPQAGSATISRSSTKDTVQIGSTGAIIQWDTFDRTVLGTAPGETTDYINFLPQGTELEFVGPGTDFTVLNRVFGAPDIDGNYRGIAFSGTVTSRLSDAGAIGGNIWFYNQGGILVHSTAAFNVGALLLTSSEIASIDKGGTEMNFLGAKQANSSIIIRSGATIEALNDGSSYVALFAPRVEQGGSINVDGSAAIVGAEEGRLTIANGLFDIAITTGTEDANGVVHTGDTLGPASTGSADAQAVYMVAVPKNAALTMLVGGSAGYQAASSAAIENGRVVLSTGNVDVIGGATNAAPLLDMTIDGGAAGSINADGAFFGSTTDIFAEDTVKLIAGTTLFDNVFAASAVGTQDLNVTAGNTISVTATRAASVGATGDVNLRAGVGAQGGTVDIILDQIGFTDTVNSGLLVGGNLTIDVSAAGADDFFIIRNNGNTGIGEDAIAGSIDIDINSGGDLIVGGDVNLLAGAQGGKGETVNGLAAGGAIDLSLSGGTSTANITGSLTMDAEAIRSQTGKIGGNGPGSIGSSSTGGDVTFTLAGGSFSAGDVTINSSATASSGSDDKIAQNNDAAAGDVTVAVTGGSHTLQSLTVTADSSAVESFDGTGARFSGNATRATVGLGISGDANQLTITDDLSISTRADGISGRSATAAVSVIGTDTGTGGGISVGGSTFIDTTQEEGSETELNIAGAVTVSASNSSLALGDLFINTDASPSGSFSGSFGNGQDFLGGTVGLTASNGGSITGGFLSISTTGIGAADSAGSGTGGRVSLLANDGTINFTSSTFIDSSGSGGVGFGDGGARDVGVGQGGDIAFTVRGTSGLLDFSTMFFTSDGQIQFDVEGGSSDFAGDGGSGNAGSVTFNIEGGTLNAGSVFVSADGSGGSGGDIPLSAMVRTTSPLRLLAPDIVPLATPVLLAPGAGASPGPISTGATQAGAGGDGVGGDVTFNLTAGTATMANLSITANGLGGSGGSGDIGTGTFGGNGGSGTGGNATFNAIAGTLTVTGTLTVAGNGIGGSGGFGNAADGGAGGNGTAGTATFNLDGTSNINANTVLVAANAVGGQGGSSFASGGNPGGVGGAGGDATAGTATFNNTSGSISFNTLTVSANGTGGDGGDNFGAGTGLADNAGGAGGTGTGGTAIINLNQDDGSDPTYTVQALGTGGDGGLGLDGGDGGAAQGGFAQLNVNDANVNLTTATVDATATGGAGGFVDGNLGFGGFGGSAVGGTAQVDVNGINAQLSSDSPLLVTAQGIGGAGSNGGGNPNDFGVTGDGGTGGDGTGGTVRVIARDGAIFNYTADGTTSAGGFGGAGGAGGAATFFVAGNGGAGGNGTGGTIEFQALTGGSLIADGNGSGTTLNASGTAGAGGDGGAGATNGTPGAAGALAGGAVSLLADGSGATLLSANAPSILNFTDTVSIDVSAIGGQDFRTGAVGADATGGTGSLTVSNGGNLLFDSTVTINANARASIGQLAAGTSTGGTINIGVAGTGSDLTITGITPTTLSFALRNRSFIGLASGFDPQTGSDQFLNATGGDTVGGNLNITQSGGNLGFAASGYFRGDAGRVDVGTAGTTVVNTASATGGTINLDFTGGTHSIGTNTQWEFDVFTQALGGTATPTLFDLLIDGADLTGVNFNVDAQTFGDVVNATATPISVIVQNGGIANTIDVFYDASPAFGGATANGVDMTAVIDNGSVGFLNLRSDVSEFSATYRDGSAHAVGGDFNVTIQNGATVGTVFLTSFVNGQLGPLGASATGGDMSILLDGATITGDIVYTNYTNGIRPNTNATAIDLVGQGGDVTFTMQGAAAQFDGSLTLDYSVFNNTSNGLEDGDAVEAIGGIFTINANGGNWTGSSLFTFVNIESSRGFDNQPGPNATGLTTNFNVGGATVNLASATIRSGVSGGFGGDGLDGGDQVAGDVSINVTSGSLTTSSLTINTSNALGFLAGGGSGIGSAGGNGGLGQAGAVSIFNDGTGTVDLGSVSITAIGEGGFAGDGDTGFAGGDGGAGIGGDVTISNTGTGTFAMSGLSIQANGIGGQPGRGGDGSIGGTGGTGTGGNVSIVTTSEFTGLTDIDISATGTGGSLTSISTARRDVIGTTGGTGQGGAIDFDIAGTGTVLAAVADLVLDASGTGGAGGTGSRGDMAQDSGTGGTGGAGIGGSVALGIRGVGANLVFDPVTFVLTAAGTGGTGGAGGDNLLFGIAGDGGLGGNGTGGGVILRAGSGSTLDLGSAGGTFILASAGTGGAGGSGGNFDMASGGVSGNGGDGGVGTGGSPTLRAVGGTIIGDNLQVNGIGTGGAGGLGGGDGTVQFGIDGDGGIGAGGNPVLEILDGSPGILTFNGVTIFANGVGGAGLNFGDTQGGRVEINDLSPDPLGLMNFSSLTVDATGIGSVAGGGMFVSGGSGAITVSNNLVVDVAGDIQYDFDGDGQLSVGNDALLTAGGNITVTHVNNLTPTNSFDIARDLTASAGGNFSAGADTILVAGREVSITAQNIGFDTITAGADNIFDAGEFALTLNATGGSIIGGPVGSLIALGGMDLDATQAIDIGNMDVDDGPITINAGTTLTTGDIAIASGGFVSNETINITAGGDTVLGNVAAIDGLTITSGGGLTATSLSATGITATASGAVDIGDATIFDGVAGGGGITISGTSIILDSADASTTVGNNIVLTATAGDASLGTINTEAFLDVTADGNITFDTLTGTGVFLISGGDVTGTFAASDRIINTARPRDVQITAPGAVTVTTLDTVNDVRVSAASFDTDSIVTGTGVAGIGSNVVVNVSGDATIRAANVNGLIDVDAATISLGTIAVAGSTTLDSTVGDIVITSIVTDQNVLANSAGDIRLGSSEKRGTDTLGNEAMTYTAAGDVVVTGVIDSHDGIFLTAGGLVDTQQLIAFDNVNVTAGTSADIAGITTTVGGTATINAATITLGASSLAGGLTANASAGDLNIAGDVTASGLFDLDATGNVGFQTLTTGGQVQVNAGGDITGVSSLKVGTDTLGNESMSFTAGGAISLTGTVDTHDSIVLSAGTTLDVGQLTAFDNITATAGTTATIAGITTTNGGNASVTAQSISLAGASVNGTLTATATAGSVNLTGPISTLGATLSATADILFTTIFSEGNLSFTAGGNVSGTDITGGANDNGGDNVTVNASGDVVITGTISALDALSVTAGGVANIASAVTTTGGAATISGRTLTLGAGNFSGTVGLTSTTGDVVLNSDLATGGLTTITSAQDILFGTITSSNSNLTLDAARDVTGTSVINSAPVGSGGLDRTIINAGRDILLTGTAQSVDDGVFLTASGGINVGTIDAADTITATAGGALVVGTANNANAFTVTLQGASVTLNNGTIFDDLVVNATAGDIAGTGTVTVGGAIDLDATGAIGFGSLAAQGGTFTADAGGDISFTAASASSGLIFTTTGAILGGTITAGNILLTAGSVAVDDVTSGAAFDLTTTGNASIGNIDAATRLALNVGGNLTTLDIVANGLAPGADINVTGNASLGSVTSAALLDIDVGGTFTGAAFQAAGPLTIDATSIGITSANSTAGGVVLTSTTGAVSATQLDATGSVQVTSAAGATLGPITAGSNVDVTTGADATLGDATAGGNLTLTIGGNLTAGALRSTGAAGIMDINVTGDAAITSAATGLILDIDVGGALSGGAFSGGSSTADAASIAITSLDGSTGSVIATATTGGATIGSISAAGNGRVFAAAGAASVGSLTTTAEGTVSGLSATLDNGTIGTNLRLQATGGSVAGTGTITVGGGIDIDATGNVGFGSLTSQGGAFTVDAGGAITFAGANSSNTIVMNAAGAINGGDLSATNALTLNGGNIAIGDASAASLSFLSAADILFNSLTSPNAISLTAASGTIGANTGAGDIDSGGDVTLLAQAFTLNDVTALGSVDATASTGDATFGTVDATGNILISAAGTPSVGNAISGGNTSITGQSVTFNNGAVGGDLALTATNGDIDGNGTVSVGGGIAMTATGNVGFGSLAAQGGSFVVDAGGAVSFSGATSTDLITMTAVGSITGGDLTATNELTLTGGNIAIGDANAANISLTSDDDILFNLLTSPNSISLTASAGTIGANTGAGDIDSGGDVSLDALFVNLNRIDATGGVSIIASAAAPGGLPGTGTGSGATALSGIVDIGSIFAGTDIVINAALSASVDHAETDGSFLATTGTSFTTGPNSIITLGDIVINAGTLVDLGNSDAGGLIDVTGQQIGFITLLAGGSVDLLTAISPVVPIVGNGNITGTDVTGGGAVTITAAGSTLINGGASAGDELTVSSAGDSLVPFASSGLDTFIEGQSVLVNDASVGGDLTLDAFNGDISGSGNGDVGGSIFMSATGNVDFGSFNALGGSFTVDAGGNIGFFGATAGDFIDMTAPGAINGGDLFANGSLTLDGGLIAIGDGEATDISLTSSTDILFNLLTSPNAITLTATNGTIGANTGAGDIDSGGDVTLEAQVIALNDVTSGGSVEATASTGNAGFGTIDAANDITIVAAGNPSLVNAISGGNTSITGQAVTFNNGSIGGDLVLNATSGDIDGTGTVTVGGGIDFDATGNVGFGSLDAGGAFTVDAGGAITFNRATSPVLLTMTAGGAINGGDLDVAGPLSLTGPTIAIGDAVADSMAIASNADILFNSLIVRGPLGLTAANGTIGANTGAGDIAADGDVTLLAQTFTLNDVTSGGSIDATASTGDAGFGAVSAVGSITILAAGTPTLRDATSGGDTSITGHSVTLDNGAVGGNLALTATVGDIASNGTLSVGGGIALTAPGNVGFGSLAAQGGDFTVTAGGDILFTQASATGRFDLLAQGGDGVSGGAIVAGGEVEIDALAGSVRTGTIAAGGGVDIGALGEVTLGDVTLTGGGADIAGGGDIALGSILGGDATGIALTSGTGGVSFIDLQASGGISILGDGGLVVGNSIASGDEVSVDGDTVQLSSVVSGNDFFGISEVGDFVIGSAQSAGEIFLIAQGLLDAGPLTAVTDITAEAGSFSGATLDAVGDITVTTASGNIDFVSATAGGSVAMTAGNDIGTSGGTRGDISAGLNIDLTGSDMRLQDLSAGGAVTIAASQSFVAQSIVAGGNVTADALLGFNVAVGGVQSGANVLVDSAGPVALGTTSAAGTITAFGGGIDYASLVAGSTITLATVTPDPDAASTGNITGGSTSAGSGLSSMSTIDGDILLAGRTGVAGGLTLTAAGDVVLSDTATVAQDMLVSASGLVETGDVTSGGSLSIDAGTSFEGLDLTSGGSLSVTSGSGNILANDLTADGGIALDSGGAIDFRFGDSLGDFSAQAAGDIMFSEVLADGAASFTSTGGGAIFGGEIASDASITANTAGAFDVLTLGPGVAGMRGPVAIAADGGIAIERLTASTGSLVAANGPVTVSVDIDMTGSLSALGTSVMLNSTHDLSVEATATTDGVDIFTFGSLEMLGATAPGAIQLESGVNLTVLGDTVAGSGLRMQAEGLVDVRALASGNAVDIFSRDIAIRDTGAVGQSDITREIVFNAFADDVLLGGDGSDDVDYNLDNNEFARVHSRGNVTLNAVGTSTGGAAVTIDDLDVLVGTSGNIGGEGGLFVFGNTIDVIGEVVVTNANLDNSLVLSASTDIFLDATSGLLEVNEDSGSYTGTIRLEAENFYALTPDAFDDIQGMSIADIDLRLAESDGLDNPEGVIRAGTLDITTTASDVFIQNTVPGTAFADRRGFTVGDLLISDPNPGQPIVINGVIGSATGVDVIPLAQISSSFDPGSTINGCLIADPSSCIASFDESPFDNPIQDLIETEFEREDPTEEGTIGDGPSALLIEVQDPSEYGEDPLIDDPVTGAGNEDLWTYDPEQGASTGEECPEDDERCELEPAE